MSEWQDFNTAPRDNTTILAASPKRADIVTVAWDVKASEWRSNVYPYLTFDGQFFTHWQPSPELPEDSANAAQPQRDRRSRMRPETQTKVELRAERDHWKKLAEEGLEPRIRDMRINGGSFDLELTGQVVEQIAVAFVSNFKALRAENYMEMQVYDRDEPFQRYIVTVQKVGKLSPHDKAQLAIGGLHEAEAFISKMSGGGEAEFRAHLNNILTRLDAKRRQQTKT